MSTRPRIEFDGLGRCNACQWAEKKKTLDWGPRQVELKNLLDAHRSNDGSFDCVVPVSGGKDGSYIAYQLKHVHGMHPLCVTVTPALASATGAQNIQNFMNSGFDLIQVKLLFGPRGAEKLIDMIRVKLSFVFAPEGPQAG